MVKNYAIKNSLVILPSCSANESQASPIIIKILFSLPLKIINDFEH